MYVCMHQARVYNREYCLRFPKKYAGCIQQDGAGSIREAGKPRVVSSAGLYRVVALSRDT